MIVNNKELKEESEVSKENSRLLILITKSPGAEYGHNMKHSFFGTTQNLCFFVQKTVADS